MSEAKLKFAAALVAFATAVISPINIVLSHR
jgi:hypothetical protein